MAKRTHAKQPHILSVLTRVIIGLSALTVALVAGAAYLVFKNAPARDVTVDFSYDEPAYVGAPFDVMLFIQNNTGQLLKDVSLQVPERKDLSVLSGTTEPVGEIGAGVLVKRTIRVIAAPREKGGAEYRLTAELSYRIGEGDFEQTYSHALTVGAAALDVSVTAPPQVVSGSEFDVTLRYENVSDIDIPGVSVELEKPSEFTVTHTSAGGSWDIGDVPAAADGTFSFSGFWYDADSSGVPPALTVTLHSHLGTEAYPLATHDIPLQVSASPLSLSVASDAGTVARAGDTITYTVSYYNQSGIALRDVTLTANLIGEMFRLSSAVSNGYFDAEQGQFRWDKRNIPAFELLPPGSRGAVEIRAPLRSDFPIRRLSDKNFAAKLEARITSPTTPYYVHANELSSVVQYTVHITGEVRLSAAGYYRDAASGIANQGVFPPRVGEATQYTIHWKLKNYSTDVRNVVVRAKLPDNATFTGTAKQTDGEAPSYDAGTGEVVWNVGDLAATRGILDAPPEAVFQVSATPDASMRGSYELLLYQTRLTAEDVFTGTALSDTADSLTTRLPSDATVSLTEGVVQ